MIDSILESVHSSGVVSVLRGIERGHMRDTLRALIAGGVSCVEITLNTDGALEMLADARAEFGGSVTLGAGTVLDAASAREAISAGADFILSPTLEPEVVALCNSLGKLAVPGCFTPTEALSAARLGAQLIKIFPAGALGAKYIKDILAPLPQLRLMPMGGVDLTNTADFFRAGAFAVGVGACLADARRAAEGRFGEITAAALELRRQAGR